MAHSSTLLVVLVLCLAGVALADVYGHNPRFSNNRLNEEGVNRNNNNRMCDTQNNAKGGYCWGPKMYYYVGSLLPIEWTSQHSCGNPNTYCEIVLQYMCGSEVRDGTTTDTIPDDASKVNETAPSLEDPNVEAYKYGMHESYQYYQDCKARSRNKGLFLADQKVGPAARNTRQNPGGGRSGFECPEERDYYPYWHPSPWKDIAILANTLERCDYYKAESQNVKGKNYCNKNEFNNELDCINGGGNWSLAEPWNIPPPDCLQQDWTRDNHLGNTKRGYPAMYNWTIPNDVNENCVLRIRYNISTNDYDNWNINSSLNGDVKSPIQNDPDSPVMGRNLTLALNTAQTGRTFQDRTHVFAIRPRPDNILPSTRIFNLNVRGKRGNIVQVYPAVEYDFVPNKLNARAGDYIHYQWTGCDTNPQNNDGEGTRGTDRSNIIQIKTLSDNFPWADMPEDSAMIEDQNTRFQMAFLNQTGCKPLEQLYKELGSKDRVERSPENCAKLNAASRYFDGGLVKMNKNGVYYYMSSRNNNFSNRSQKGRIIIEPLLPTWAVALILIGGVLFVAALVFGVASLYASSHPDSKVSHALGRLERFKVKVPLFSSSPAPAGSSDVTEAFIQK